VTAVATVAAEVTAVAAVAGGHVDDGGGDRMMARTVRGR